MDKNHVRVQFPHNVIVTFDQPSQAELSKLDWQRDGFLKTEDAERGVNAILSMFKSILVSIENADGTGKIEYKGTDDAHSRITSLLFLESDRQDVAEVRELLLTVGYQVAHGVRYPFFDRNGQQIDCVKVIPSFKK